MQCDRQRACAPAGDALASLKRSRGGVHVRLQNARSSSREVGLLQGDFAREKMETRNPRPVQRPPEKTPSSNGARVYNNAIAMCSRQEIRMICESARSSARVRSGVAATHIRSSASIFLLKPGFSKSRRKKKKKKPAMRLKDRPAPLSPSPRVVRRRPRSIRFPWARTENWESSRTILQSVRANCADLRGRSAGATEHFYLSLSHLPAPARREKKGKKVGHCEGEERQSSGL